MDRCGVAQAVCLCVVLLSGCGRGKEEANHQPAAPAQASGSQSQGGAEAGQEAIVAKSAGGVPALAQKDGKPYDGVKLSQYDAEMFSPQIACASDGTIHVAFVERMAASPYTFFVFHRQSSDEGKSWSEAKNLSEDMPGLNIGTCRLCIDGQDRVFVIWRTGLKEQFPTAATPAARYENNLVYRMLDHGKWTKILPVHPPGSPLTQDDGSISYSACTDAGGHVQVIYNTIPDRFDTQKYACVSGQFVQHCPGVQAGLIWQATLDGTPGQPKQLMCVNFHTKPAEGVYGKYCDGVNAIDAYADATGAPHFIAQHFHEDYRSDASTEISLFEGGNVTPALKLPSTFQFEANPTKLLVDAAGKKHIIALYDAGEHPCFRDYVIGSNDEPTTLLSAKAPRGTCLGFQAFQAAGGKMLVLMQTTDEGMDDKGDSWLTTSDGGAWSEPICITNNAGRETWWSKQTSVLHGVAGGSRFGPGAGAAAIDRSGHVVVALINVEVGSFGQSAGGVVYMSGSTSTPRLCFYRF